MKSSENCCLVQLLRANAFHVSGICCSPNSQLVSVLLDLVLGAVGQKTASTSGVSDTPFNALARANTNIRAIA
ncbi:hypothetical protein WN944_015275 [Citrus x changshan-huyou]|uniref:Uncharacterized protein n=1 Tax=Citrus x changshan-huyou TaxID=2935761 RepID=A0AAP0MC67_9ROSI